jgi:predicted porin
MKFQFLALARFMTAAALLLGAAQRIGAVELGDVVSLHGYGSQDYAQTSANTYLDADPRGTWNNNFLGLVGTVTINDRSKLWAQLETSSQDSTHFTWFFVDYQITGELSAHVGRVKFPLGLYNEIIDAKFLQLSSLEPSLYQSAADFVHDSYNGLGLDYNQDLGASGVITWQLYGGNAYDPVQPVAFEDRRIAGVRVTYASPIDGLRFLLSAYLTQVQVLASGSANSLNQPTNVGHLINETRWIGSVDYVHAEWDLKAEYGTHSLNGVDSCAYYLQGGRTFGERWTPFVRYDFVTTNKSQQSNPAYFQRTVVAGMNYKLLSNISVRVEAQRNQGFALPVASGQQDVATAKRDWTMFIVGAHFVF